MRNLNHITPKFIRQGVATAVSIIVLLAPIILAPVTANADDLPELHFFSLANASKNAIGNSKLKFHLSGTAAADETLIVSVAVGGVRGKVRCSDTQGNEYRIAVNKRVPTDRLFMCVAAVTHPLDSNDIITVTYPAFDGISIGSVEHVVALDSPGVVDTTAKGSGQNITVNAGPVTPSASRELLFGVVLTQGASNSFSTAGSEEYQAYSHYGSNFGTGDKKLTTYYFTSGDPTFTPPYALDGFQTVQSSWIAVQTGFLATQSKGSGADN